MMNARKVPALNGWLWIKQGWALFSQSGVLWSVLGVVGVGSMMALSLMPVVGEPLATLLFPVLLAGYMQGCRALERGEELELAHLFSGFSHHSQALITLGGVNLVGQLLIFGVMMVTGGATLASIFMGSTQVDDPAIFAQAVAGAGFALALGAVLFILLLMAGQYAPMLVIFGNVKPIEALKRSLRACLDNIIPMSVYGLLMLPFALLATLPAMLGWLVLLPVMMTSMYAAYHDIFDMAAPQQEERSAE